MENINNSINLLKSIPESLLGKLNITQSTIIDGNGEIEVIILYGTAYSDVNNYVNSIGGKLDDLGYGYGIVNIPIEQLGKLAANPNIQYIELPKSLYFTDEGSNRAACVQRTQSTFGLQGQGTVIGFIDSGIDFTHPAFRNDDGTTRIEYIYDLSTGGSTYSKQQINEALKAPDPYSVVPVIDVTEHGTHVAGIACGGGRINSRYYGVAPKSSIMMVKSGRGLFSLSTQIMRGLKFLVDKGRELGMPLVVNISLSTNDGAHNGTSLLEQYINTIAILERITIVIAAGNEGDAAHHVGGNLADINEIRFNVAEDETAVVINLYKSVLPKITIELITPTGVSSGEIVVEEGLNEGVISRNRYRIFNTGPKPFDMSGEIGISLISGSNYILSGEWKVILRTVNKYEGIYDMWLPISEGLNQKTKFLQPTVNNTLGIPATVSNVISVGSYNYITRNISSFSGRGRNVIYSSAKPELVAPGEGITSAAPNGSFDTKTGTSMAAPHVSGICGLLMEWGIVRGNDPFLYGDRLKYYLIIGSKKERTDIVYPDPSWGYGEVCAYDSMEELIRVLNIIGEDNFVSREGKMYREVGDIDEYLKQFSNSSERVGILVEYTNREKFLELNNLPNISSIALNESFGIVYLPVNELGNIREYIKKGVADINPQIFTLNDMSPAEASNALNYHNNPYLSLDGKGVLIGIIDTGIDYLNTEFQKEDDTTRIIRLWDQTIDSGKDIYGIKLGTEYREEDINEAIKLQKSGGDPYTIVPSKDTNGHGTMAAGLAAARGKDPDLVGVAPGCSLAVVKLKEVSNVVLEAAGVTTPGSNRYGVVDILTAIRYLSILSTELKIPLVILFPLGSNNGPHDGLGTLDGSINEFSRQIGSVFVAGTGNEGDTDTHTEGTIEKTGDSSTIELRVGKNQGNLNFEIWVPRPDMFLLSIISPSGEVIDNISPKFKDKTNVKFIYEGTSMAINYNLPERTNGDEQIIIRCLNLKEGIWRFRLYGEYVVGGKYWSWLPQRSLLAPDTKFLSPTQNTTLTIPSGANGTISVAYYNQNNNSTVGASGRGYTRDGRVKPDIAAGGINAKIIRTGGGTGVASGSSVATSIVAGVCAMILQWAIIDGNFPVIYAQEVISYIIRGAKMRSGDTYPNPEWGYGTIDVTGIFNAMRGNYNVNSRGYEDKSEEKYEEYNVGRLFIRSPL
ncbi:S8 family serine peptidase [Clostridium paraputrificum]|uniref:S8 family serine peptidase n=1 Tax=Clostridium paraputrificum TaxID=29363 RepID=UPI003D357AFC